jgi:hypothetical protein
MAETDHKFTDREVDLILRRAVEMERLGTTPEDVRGGLTLPELVGSGNVASNTRAGRWAPDHVPKEFHELIHRALETADSVELEGLPVPRLCDFIEYTRVQVDSMPPFLQSYSP